MEDDAAHLLGGGLTEIGGLDGADDFEAVGAGKVGPGIVVGEEPAVFGRDGLGGLADGGVETI